MNDSLRKSLDDLQAEVECDCWSGVACTQDCYSHRGTFRALSAILDICDERSSWHPRFNEATVSLIDTDLIRRAIAKHIGEADSVSGYAPDRDSE